MFLFRIRIISVADPGCLSRIRHLSTPDPGSELSPSRIPDPGVKKVPDPGSASLNPSFSNA